MNSALATALLILVLLWAFFSLRPRFRVVWGARQGIAWQIRRCVRALAVYVIAVVVALRILHCTTLQAFIIGVLVEALAMFRYPKRARRIPKHVRRKVIERDVGLENWDWQRFHIDHRVPFSRGGSHTVDNLRVISKTANLRKGGRRPRSSDSA